MGIPNSLRFSGNREWSDEFALEQSIKQGVTRYPKFGQATVFLGLIRSQRLVGEHFILMLERPTLWLLAGVKSK